MPIRYYPPETNEKCIILIPDIFSDLSYKCILIQNLMQQEYLLKVALLGLEQEIKVKCNSATLFFLSSSLPPSLPSSLPPSLPSFLSTFKFYSLSKLQLYNTVLSIIVTMVYVRSLYPQTLFIFQLGVCILLPPSPYSPPPSGPPPNHFSVLCFYEFDFIFLKILHMSDTMQYLSFFV